MKYVNTDGNLERKKKQAFQNWGKCCDALCPRYHGARAHFLRYANGTVVLGECSHPSGMAAEVSGGETVLSATYLQIIQQK